jgi:hypothetical protein
MDNQLKMIDHRAMQVTQVMVIILNILAFVLDQPYLALFTGLVSLVGVALNMPGFSFIYQPLKSAGLLNPEILADHPEPHRFSQLLGGMMALGGGLFVIGGLPMIGWALTWIHAALAALNAFGGFCVGCFMYYWLSRIGVPGFHQSPPPGTRPGIRPTENRI